MKDPNSSKLTKEIAWGVKQDLFNDKKGRNLIRLWRLRMADETVMSMLMYRINKEKTAQLFNNNPFKIPKGKL